MSYIELADGTKIYVGPEGVPVDWAGDKVDLLRKDFRDEISEFRDKIAEQTLRPIG